ncbi:MAG: thioredoxin domain-containing protein [Fibrobacteria bacterium]|nr:thioredoxin domain-containing protein [Fibrobacteria bacterium]
MILSSLVLVASLASAKPVLKPLAGTPAGLQCLPGQEHQGEAALPCEARLDSLAREVAFLVRVLEGKGIDFDKERRLLALADSVFDIPTDPSLVLGPAKAPHTLAIFTDPECPYCQRIYPQLDVWLAAHKDLKVAIHFFPLSFHPRAIPAAKAYWAASRQGKIAPFLKNLHADGAKDLSDEALLRAATASGCDASKFQSDWASDAAQAAVDKDLKLGERVGVQGTPSLYLDGKATRNPDADLERMK